jgi:hypothetical protein
MTTASDNCNCNFSDSNCTYDPGYHGFDANIEDTLTRDDGNSVHDIGGEGFNGFNTRKKAVSAVAVVVRRISLWCRAHHKSLTMPSPTASATARAMTATSCMIPVAITSTSTAAAAASIVTPAPATRSTPSMPVTVAQIRAQRDPLPLLLSTLCRPDSSLQTRASDHLISNAAPPFLANDRSFRFYLRFTYMHDEMNRTRPARTYTFLPSLESLLLTSSRQCSTTIAKGNLRR